MCRRSGTCELHQLSIKVRCVCLYMHVCVAKDRIQFKVYYYWHYCNNFPTIRTHQRMGRTLSTFLATVAPPNALSKPPGGHVQTGVIEFPFPNRKRVFSVTKNGNENTREIVDKIEQQRRSTGDAVIEPSTHATTTRAFDTTTEAITFTSSSSSSNSSSSSKFGSS